MHIKALHQRRIGFGRGDHPKMTHDHILSYDHAWLNASKVPKCLGGTLDCRTCRSRYRRVQMVSQEVNVRARYLFGTYSVVSVTKLVKQILENIERFSVSKASQR